MEQTTAAGRRERLECALLTIKQGSVAFLRKGGGSEPRKAQHLHQ